MPRQRMIKPQFWDDTKLGKISRDARLLYIGMWNFADDKGVIPADAIWIKSKIFPIDAIQIQQFEKWLGELLQRRFISLFSFDNEEFYYLRNFAKHQTINRPNEKEFFVPLEVLESFIDNGFEPFTDQSVINHGIINDESLPKEKKRKEKEEEKKTRDARSDSEKKIEVEIPFKTEKFLTHWQHWKDFKKKQFNFEYKSALSEQQALIELTKLAPDEETACKVILQSIGQGWKGLFALKQNSQNNGNQRVNNNTGSNVDARSAFDTIDRMFGKNTSS